MSLSSPSILQQSVTRLQSRVRESLIEDILAHSIVSHSGKHPVRTEVHASSVIADDWCSREFVLGEFHPEQAIQNTNTTYYHLHNIFEYGWEVHRKWQGIFLSQGLAVINEQEGKPELDLTHYDPESMIYYSPDAIIKTLGRVRVVEIKGINTDEYQSVCNLPLEIAVQRSQTIKKARQQVNLYMYLLGIDDGLVLAEDKNTQAYRVWECKPDQSVLKPLLARLHDHKLDHVVYRDSFNTILPPRYKACTSASSSRARRCPMRELCFSMQEGEL